METLGPDWTVCHLLSVLGKKLGEVHCSVRSVNLDFADQFSPKDGGPQYGRK